MPIPPAMDECRYDMERVWRIIYDLVNNLTGAEEAAIRQIAPLISIVSLRNGNIASRGNTSCVYQKSRLSKILPNLPSECRYIVIRRRQRSRGNNNNYSLKETKFSRDKIAMVLRLLKGTCEPWTDITVSEERLARWPVQGDLVDLNDQVVTIKDNKEQEQPESNNDDQNQSQDHASQIELNNDGDDYGPAPLQNDVVPDENYEGVLNIGESTTAQGSIAGMAVNQINQTVRGLREDVVNGSKNLTNGMGNTVHFAHDQIYESDTGFVDMNKEENFSKS